MKLVYTWTNFYRETNDKCVWTVKFTFEDVLYREYEVLVKAGDTLHSIVRNLDLSVPEGDNDE